MAIARELRNGSTVMNKIFPSCTQPLRIDDQNLRKTAIWRAHRRTLITKDKFSRILPFQFTY
ncbi:hypothetical protein EIQ31_09930 [Agrobacterium deltaense]|nr:hypothetical protein EIQ31_09930 [Agrobacterium deltaense]